MEPRDGTWAEVGPGVVIRDPKLKHWLVLEEKSGWVRLRGALMKIVDQKRLPPTTPVTIMEASETEAILLVGRQLAGHMLRHENEKTLPLRAMKFRMDPVGRTKDAVRGHIDMHHSVYVNDGWTAKTAKELHQAHEEMHETQTMTTPHHHGGT